MRHCRICSGELSPAELDLYSFPTITSDCRPWSAGRSVATCKRCSMTQRMLLPEAASLFDTVYVDYEMFRHAQASSDQLSFDGSGAAEGRTRKILGFVQDKLTPLPRSVLDIGSGSGAGLIALASQFPHALIHGYEPNDRPAERQAALPGNVSVLKQLPAGEKYDLITMFHVLEHVDDVFKLFDFISSALSEDGQVLIQVPYPARNPFDFIIADHIWHFSKESIVSLLRKVNFGVGYIGNELIEKELTVIARPGASAAQSMEPDEFQRAAESIAWLRQYKLFLDRLKEDESSLAVYGTGPAGAWTGAILGDKVSAYLEDDPARIHSRFNERPVISPKEIGTGITVVAAFPEKQAQSVARQNKELNIVHYNKPVAK